MWLWPSVYFVQRGVVRCAAAACHRCHYEWSLLCEGQKPGGTAVPLLQQQLCFFRRILAYPNHIYDRIFCYIFEEHTLGMSEVFVDSHISQN